ncbi:uncharacterized protein LOC134814847 isoform X2 [Bolinopsis microptera]|uniref:uncharacterized protein LOC134814847 isoform X2 n=1 Tax=Bolinopsis microptera TaxID=2820187 RepID=UPI00307A7EC1
MLSALSQGYGVCRKDGVILIPEASGAIPSYSTQVKNAEGTLYGHFVPVPKTFLTRRGDIILFTENACDIMYLEEMYSRKIRELYEQQIKTVDDLNKSILFYGSKTPGEYSLNFIRGKFYSDRDIAVQPGHLPTHYLNSLTRHIKLSSVLRPRAPVGPPTGTPFGVDPVVKNIKLPVPGLTDVMESSDDVEEYDGQLVVKRDKKEKSSPSPVDKNKLPPIQFSKKYDPRPAKGGGSPTLHKVKLNSDTLGLHGTNALPPQKGTSEIPTLPKVMTGPSAKGKSQGDWKKLGTLIGSVNVLKRLGESKQKERETLKEAEEAKDQKPIYRSAMAMDIHFLKENRRHISRGDPEAALGADMSLDDILLGLKDRHGKKPVLPPLQVQWSPEVDKRERQERQEREEKEELVAEETLSRKGSGNTRKSPKQSNTATPRRTSPYPVGGSRNSPDTSVKKPSPVANSTSLNGKMISPFGEKTVSPGSKTGSRVGSKEGSRKGSGKPVEEPVSEPPQPPIIYQSNWSPDAAEQELPDIQIDVDMVNADMDEYQDHVQQARMLLALQQQQQQLEMEEEELRRLEEEEAILGGSPNSIPALFVDDTDQVYVGEIYGDVEPDRSLNPNVPFDYMGLVRSLSRHDNAAETGELALQSQSLGGGGSMSQPLQPGLYVMRPSNTAAQQLGPQSGPQLGPQTAQSREPLGIGGLGGTEGRPFTENVKRQAPPRSARRRIPATRGNLEDGQSLAPGSSGLNVPRGTTEKPKKGGYVFREAVSDTGPVTPDQRLPQRILHQKEPKSGYIFKKGGDHSILDVPERQRGVRSESTKKNSGYVLKKGIPQTGVPSTHDRSRRVPRQSKRSKNLTPSQTKDLYPSFSMDKTTRDIIGALESNEDTSKYDQSHLDTAKAIRDSLRATDPNFSLEKMEAEYNPSGDGGKVLTDAQTYLEEVSRLRQDMLLKAAEMENEEEDDYYMDDTDYEEEYYDEDYTDEAPNEHSLQPADNLMPRRPNGTPNSPDHNHHNGKQTSQEQPSINIGLGLQQDYIETPLSQHAAIDSHNMGDARTSHIVHEGQPVNSEIGRRPTGGRPSIGEDSGYIPHSDVEGDNYGDSAVRHAHSAYGDYNLGRDGEKVPSRGHHSEGGSYKQGHPHSPYSGYGADDGEEFPEGITGNEDGNKKNFNRLNTFLGGTPDFEFERAPGVPLRNHTPKFPPSQIGTPRTSPPDRNSDGSPKYSDSPRIYVSTPGAGLSGQPTKVKVQSFGSTEVPFLPTMGDERYVINPSIPYPSVAQQDTVHYTTHELVGAYNPRTHKGVLGVLPKRNMPAHLLFRSQAGTPGRVRSSRKRRDKNRPKSAVAADGIAHGFNPQSLSAALTDLKNLPDIKIGPPSSDGSENRRSLRSSSIDSGMLDGEEAGMGGGGLEHRLDDTAENLERIVKLRSELADNFQHNSTTDLDMFSDITDSEVPTTPLRESDLISDVAVPGLLDIPEETADHHKGTKKQSGPLDGCHAGVYLTQLCRDGVWTNEDVPVYVTPDGKVFISSVIVNQPVCSSDRIKFAQQDDADDVHNKPEEGSLTFSDGKLTGWVKFPGQKAVKIRGKRWDPRQTGHYVIEKRVVPRVSNADAEGERMHEDDKPSSWQLVPLDLSIMLGGKVTINDEPVFNPLFEENNLKLCLNENEQIEADMKCIMAAFDPTCTEFSGKLTSDEDVEIKPSSHIRIKTKHHEVEIRGRKWNPALVGHYYCLKKSESGKWEPYNMPLEIRPSGVMMLKDVEMGVPPYNGNEVEIPYLFSEMKSLPDSISLKFLDGKYVGSITTGDEIEEIRGIRWDPAMIGKYSTQEKLNDSWINKSEILSIAPDGSVDYDGRNIDHGFIVDNKVFVVDEGGVDSFFNNTGPVSDANLSGKSFLMQRDSPVRQIAATQTTSLVMEQGVVKSTDNISAKTIQEAEIVFSSNRFYGHVTSDQDAQFVEIRGYKWDEAIVGEYFTEVLKDDGTWGGGPTITITPDGEVKVEKVPMTDTLLKDNIVSISDITIPNRKTLQKCLVAIQDKLLTGWIQESEDSPKIQIRGSLWKEGPGAHGTYICTEKIGDKWVSSNKSVIVTPSNKVRISEMSLEGDMDGLSAGLEPALSASTDDIDIDTSAKLRFEGDTFSGFITSKEAVTEIAGFKFDTVPGVYLLESRSLNADEDWTGLSLQLVVSDNGRISISGNAVYNIGVKEGTLQFDSDSILKQLSKLQFADKSVFSEGLQLGKDGNTREVEVRGSTWYPKIAGTYETELFTDSGWKSSKKLEITPQGEVLFGNEPAENIRLDSDTVTFGSVDGQLQDVTLAFDTDGFSGNVVTMKDRKNRVMRGKRVGTRPVSANSATELSLGTDEEDGFNDLNGQIGSTLPRNSAGKPSADEARPDPTGPGVTSDYGSASDVITQQLSGSRTEALSSLEEDISMRSKSPESLNKNEEIKNQGRRSAEKFNSENNRKAMSPIDSPRDGYRSSSGKALKGSPTKSESSPRSSKSKSSRGSPRNRASDSQENIALGDISLDLDGGDGDEGGVSFESWPPATEDQGKADLNFELDSGVTLDILPKGLDSLGASETKESIEVVSPKESPTSLPKAPIKSKIIAPKALAKAGRETVAQAQVAEAEVIAASRSPARVTEAEAIAAPSSKASDNQSDRSEASGDNSADPEIAALNSTSPTTTLSPTSGEASPEASDDSAMLKGTPKLPDIGGSIPSDSQSLDLSSSSPGKQTRSPDKSPRSFDSPALTKPVKLPGIDMKAKGAAAEITEDAGLLKNYIEPKGKKGEKKKRARKPKKTKAKNELRPDLNKEAKKVEDDKTKDGVESGSPPDINERARQGIGQAQSRRTPTARTPVHMSKIDRDSSRDSTPISSGYTTPNSGPITPSNSLPQREFQGALMAAKKIRETSDEQLDGKIPSDIREHPVAEEVAEKFGMEMQVRDDGSSKLSVKERRELARQRKKEEAERKRRDRDDEKRRHKEEEERKLREEEEMKLKRAERDAELAAERQRELGRRKEEEAKRRQAKLDEKDRRRRDEDKMLDAKRKLEEELKRRRAAEAARLEEIERQKELLLEREKEEQQKRKEEAEAIRAQMEEEMAREMAEYERKVREEQERRRIEDALKAEAERRLLDEEERKRIIALARHLWNKGVRIEGENLEEELQISSIFYSYFNYLQSEEPFNPDVDIPYKEKVLRIENALKSTRPLDKI